MMKMLLGCALLALSACATTTAPAQRRVAVKVVERSEVNDGTSDPNKTYICEEAQKPGSQMKGSVCQSLAEKERQRVAAQDAIHRMMMSGSRRP
jgi:hypothetical protein